MVKPSKGMPKQIIVYGKRYKVEYVENMADVDIDKRSALWGQIDYHTRTIRIYIGKGDRVRQPSDILETLIHEIIHAVLEGCKALDILVPKHTETFVDTLGTMLADTLLRNDLVKK